IGSFGQVSLKHGMNRLKVIGMMQVLKSIFKVFTNPFIIMGVLLYAVSSVIWLFSMTRLDISFMYPLVSLSYLFTTIFAILFLNEKVSAKRWAGLTLIIIGAVMMMFGA
ncbi:MAG: EamA family transporter, partial [Candidatus Woesearchaeota archaeon]|nr:EamA family transporter [Candidatus Woesearchaeota archaeon]